jgi:nicotinate-nucleotide--dimethylbenzimidazole phosphoribosyltransferase
MGVIGNLAASHDLLTRKVAPGTRDMCTVPAMSTAQATQAIETGIEIVNDEVKKGLDIVATGEMGIGNTTASAAICSIFTGHTPAEVTGRGTGLDDKQLKHKINMIEKALTLHNIAPEKTLDVLSRVGGFEIGGLAGVILGAASHRVAVVVDGYISGAAALIAAGLCPQVKDYLIAGHTSVEPGHKYLLQYLGLKPLLDLNLRLGEGTGAALGISLVETACRILSDMATFAEAGVSNKGKGFRFFGKN